MTPGAASFVFDGLSKAALIDALWCACQLGTDESEEQILSRMARESKLAIDARGDKPSSRTRAALDTLANLYVDGDLS
jgi:hypothetical protein